MQYQTACLHHRPLLASRIGGGSVDLSDFARQKLVVYFCSGTDSEEVAAFGALAKSFERAGAWVVGIHSSDHAAFAALSSLYSASAKGRPEDGATFVIDRDGHLRHFWPGPGHARDALEVVRERP